MRLGTIKLNGLETAGIIQDELVFTIASINDKFETKWPTKIFCLLQQSKSLIQ